MKFKRKGRKWSEEEKKAFRDKLAGAKEGGVIPLSREPSDEALKKGDSVKGTLIVILPSDEFMKFLNEKGVGLKIDKEVKYFERRPEVIRSVAVFGYKLGSYDSLLGVHAFFRSDDGLTNYSLSLGYYQKEV